MLEGAVHTVQLGSCAVRYRHVARAGAPRVVLLHGGGAHAGWWVGALPGFTGSFDVVLPDLSGHGDSDHRNDYSPEGWAAEVAAVIEDVEGSPVSVVGHSMGGLVGIYLGVRRPDLVERLVVVDSALRQPGPEGWEPRGKPIRPKRVYASLEDGLARFKLRPPETTADPELLARVGRHALKRVDGGWTWKFDPEYSQRFNDVVIHRELSRLEIPFGIVFGERSPLAGPDTVAYVEQTLGRPVASASVADAYHHVPLDNPEGCREAVEGVLQKLGLRIERGSV